MEGSRAGGAELISGDQEEDTRNRTKLQQGTLKLDIRKSFFIKRVIGLLNKLLREVVMAPNLSEFKGHLDDALSHDFILGSPARKRELDTTILMGPFHPEMILWLDFEQFWILLFLRNKLFPILLQLNKCYCTPQNNWTICFDNN